MLVKNYYFYDNNFVMPQLDFYAWSSDYYFLLFYFLLFYFFFNIYFTTNSLYFKSTYQYRAVLMKKNEKYNSFLLNI